MHVKFSLLALIPFFTYSADMVEAFRNTSLREPGQHAMYNAELSCVLAAMRLPSDSTVVQVAVPYFVTPHRFRELYQNDGGIAALYNIIKLAQIKAKSSDAFFADMAVKDFYRSYDAEFNGFGEPLQAAFGQADFDAHKLLGMLDNLPSNAQGNMTFVDIPDIQPMLTNPFATANGNVLGRYHAQLGSQTDFAHGIIFRCPRPDNSGSGFISVLACKEKGTRYYFVADPTNRLPLAAATLGAFPPVLQETPGEHNPLLAFVRGHLETPNPIYCLPEDQDPVAAGFQNLQLGGAMQE